MRRRRFPVKLRRKTKFRLQIAASIAVLFFAFFFLGIVATSNSRSSELSSLQNNDTAFIERSCVDVNNRAGYVFDVCYDLATENVFIDAKRGSFDVYTVRGFEVSYLDGIRKSVRFSEVPDAGSKRTYNFEVDVPPSQIELVVDVVRDFPGSVCTEPKRLFVRACQRDVQDTQIGEISELGSNVSFADKEDYWRGICASDWKCEEWGECLGGVQRRSCMDLSECHIPVDIPRTARYCASSCNENWDCEWSSCESGFTTPTCVDSNACGTAYTKPRRTVCAEQGNCVPDISCGPWSECRSVYSFVDFEEERSFNHIEGERSRVCFDSHSCAGTITETESCLRGVDIRTETTKSCGVEYYDLYNSLDGEFLARLDDGSDAQSYLSINFGQWGSYCSHCFNGVLDDSEERIDCGGACISCAEKYRLTSFRKEGFFDRILGLF